MRKRRITFALLVALALVMAVPASAFASGLPSGYWTGWNGSSWMGTDKNGSNNAGGRGGIVPVELEVQADYIILIPKKIEFTKDQLTTDGAITLYDTGVTGARVMPISGVAFRFVGSGSDEDFTIQQGGQTMSYNVVYGKGATPTTTASAVKKQPISGLRIGANPSESDQTTVVGLTFTLDVPPAGLFAGTYSGTLSFQFRDTTLSGANEYSNGTAW